MTPIRNLLFYHTPRTGGREAHTHMRLEQVKGWLRALLFRLVLVVGGGVVLAIALSINRGAGRAILAGLLSPDSTNAIVISVTRLLITAIGLWMIYRGLR